MIRGTKRPLEKKLDLRASIHNRFDVEVIDAFTGEVKQRARAFNLICDALWTRLLHDFNGAWSPQQYFTYILFGTGEGTPSAADTALFTLLGARSVSNTTMTSDVGSGVIYRQGFITLQAEEYVGATLTEVGVGYDSTHIVTHALLEDMNGNPISIEKTAADVIKIYATIYVHFSAGGWYSGAVSLAPTASDYEEQFFRALTGVAMSSVTYFIIPGVGPRTGSLTGPSRDMTTLVDAAAKKIAASARIPAGEQNLPIRCIVVEVARYGSSSYYGVFTFCLTPGAWAPMAEIKAEPCGTGDGSSTGFSTAFPVKTGSKVYVDGVQASGAVIRPGPADGDRLERWMNRVASLSTAGTPLYAAVAYSVYNDGISFDLQYGASSDPLENPFYAAGLGKVRFWEMNSSNTQAEILASDDLEHWTSAGTVTLPYRSWAELTVPAALRTMRYWRVTNPSQSRGLHAWVQFVADAADPAHNIIFSSPPAAGAVITCDYVPDCIPKDENHVFDLTLELTLGEYQEV